MTISRASEALRELTNGIQVIEQGDAIQDTEKEKVDEPLQHIVLLENVEFVTSLPHATSCTDLSTMDEPITKEMAKCIFSRRIVPSEIPMTAPDNPSDISTLYGGKHMAGEHELDDELDEDEPEFDIEKGNPETQAATMVEVQVSFPWHQRVLRQRSRTEIFFMLVIGMSSSILVVLLVIVLR